MNNHYFLEKYAKDRQREIAWAVRPSQQIGSKNTNKKCGLSRLVPRLRRILFSPHFSKKF